MSATTGLKDMQQEHLMYCLTVAPKRRKQGYERPSKASVWITCFVLMYCINMAEYGGQ